MPGVSRWFYVSSMNGNMLLSGMIMYYYIPVQTYLDVLIAALVVVGYLITHSPLMRLKFCWKAPARVPAN